MLKENLHVLLFAFFAVGLPIWAMGNNAFEQDSIHRCAGECYANWTQETRGAQSALMWSQSAMLSDEDMKNIAAFVETL